MNRQQGGFTLIELVMVIVILGVLAATAIPKFVNLQSDAQQSAVDGVAGALGSASAINYAVRSLNASNGIAVANCNQLGGALEGGLPTGYTLEDKAITAGSTTSCTVTGEGSTTATFTAHGIS